MVAPTYLESLEVLSMTIDLVATDLPIAITHDLCDQSCVLSTICLRFQIVLVAATSGLNMTYDLAAIDFALAITHDLCDKAYVLSTISPRFQHFRSQGGRNLVVSLA